MERASLPVSNMGGQGCPPHKKILGIYLIGSPLLPIEFDIKLDYAAVPTVRGVLLQLRGHQTLAPAGIP